MGKRRNTAKTGDQALYKSRNDTSSTKNGATDDDDMYNEVERFHNAKEQLKDDMLRFDGEDDDDSSDDNGTGHTENVFDLQLSDSEDEDDDKSEDSDDSSDEGAGKNMEDDDNDSDSGDDEVDFSSDDDDLDDIREQANKVNVMNWGKKKKDYYHGDTADLEIGQEVEDAELEEKAGKEVLEMRLKNMKEDDFMPDFDDDDDSSDEKKDGKDVDDESQSMAKVMQSTKMKNLSKLTKKEKRKILEQNHPELLPLISHFRDEFIRPLAEETLVVKNAMFQNEENAKAVGATRSGLNYLITKTMLETSAALNVCQYLLLKSDNVQSKPEDDVEMTDMLGGNEDPITSHPVISRLNELNTLSKQLDDSVEAKVPGLKKQLKNLVEASKLMTNESDNDDSESDDSESDDSEMNSEEEDTPNQASIVRKDSQDEDESIDKLEEYNSSSEDELDLLQQRQQLNEARFSLRPEDDIKQRSNTSKHQNRQRRPVPSFTDYGEEDDDVNADRVTAAGRALASTMNTISQRSNKSSKSAMNAEDEDDAVDDRFMKGLEMMDADLGEDEEHEDQGDNELDNSLDESDDDFYSKVKKRSKEKKELKKSQYAVAPKYPKMDIEIEGERPVGHTIMKNRGLVAHKNKLNRNPRVKKREQYRKALIRRRGAVRDIRTDEVHRYGGEETGIKSGVSRSRKLK